MKSLFSNPVYMLFILVSVIQFNAFVNMIFFMPKYLEQQYGKSTSDAVFLIGMFVLCISSPLPPSPSKMVNSVMMGLGNSEMEIY